MGLFDKRNKVEKVVDADKLIQNEIKLLTHEEQCELVSGKKDDWGSCEEHKISATPFAVANLAYQSSSYTQQQMENQPHTPSLARRLHLALSTASDMLVTGMIITRTPVTLALRPLCLSSSIQNLKQTWQKNL